MVNLPIEYSDKQVTPFGGMSLMKRLIDKTGIRDFFSELNLPQPGSNRGYSPNHIIESFWLDIWTGASRYIHCDWLRSDKVLQPIFCWDQMPSQSTYRHFALNKHNKSTLKILKVYCFALGVWRVNHANKKVLKISLNTKRRP